MINFRLPIPGADTTVTRPVVLSIIKEIKKYLEIDENVTVLAQQDIDEFINNNWNIHNSSDNREMKPTIIRLSYKESLDPETYYTKMFNNSKKPIFEDKGVTLTPVYLNNKIEFTIRIETKSKSYINSTRDKLRMIFLDGRDVVFHNIFYKYYLDSRLLIPLKAIYDIKKKRGIVTVSFAEYLFANSDGRISLVSDQGNTKTNIIFKETQSQVIGRFTSDMLNNEPTYDNDTGRYTIELSYIINYEKATYTHMSYPYTIANEVLPSEFITMDHTSNEYSNSGVSDSVVSTFERLSRDRSTYNDLLHIYNKDYIRIPAFDNHIPCSIASFEVVIFSVLVTIDLQDKKNLFNLRELGSVVITDLVLKYLKYDREYITKSLESMFTLKVYANCKYLKDLPLKVDEDLNVYVDEDLDIETEYRVLFVVNRLKDLWSPDAKRRYDKFIKDNKIDKIEKILLSNDPNHFVNDFNKIINSGNIFTVAIDPSLIESEDKMLRKSVQYSYIKTILNKTGV